jgi:hypothetical protein
MIRPLSVTTAILAALALAACGGSSKHSSSASSSTTRPPQQAPVGGSASVTTGPVHARLTAQDHGPRVTRPWHYSVTVTDAAGKPLSGTVDVEFVFGGTVVGHDSPPTHALRRGRWHDYLQFPAQAAGQSISLQAVVHTRLGAVTLDWPVSVQS